jgi:NAD(P)-dependent dehydrogenase (short-subunit alcohol dehydrogenase family)
VIPIKADITTRAGVDALFAEIHKVAGPVDILVNNAGGAYKLGPAEDLADDNRVWNSAVNIDGMINCTLAAGKDMLAKGKGSIINISSNAAVLSQAAHYTSHYAGVKGFVISYGRGVAAEWAPRGVRINTICPGLIVPHSNSHVPGKGSWWNRPTLPDAGKPEDFADDTNDEMYRNSGALIRRVGRPEDIAHLALYFASDVSSYVTGQVVSVSGGGYMP